MAMRRASARAWVAAAMVVLAGCGGGTHPTPSGQPPPSGSASVRPFPTYRPIQRAADRWFRLIAEDRKRTVYQELVSAQCQRWMSFAQFRQLARPLKPGLRIATYRPHGVRQRGYVLYVDPSQTDNPEQSSTAWEWILEHGHWKSNDRPRPDPGAT
jgi:hypothetical protein